MASKEEESFANCFASNLLLPPEPLQTAVDACTKSGHVQYEDLFDVARQFDVSIDALLWQMHFVYNRGPDNADSTKAKIDKAKNWRSIFERRTNTKPAKWPDRYWALAMRALRHGEMSIGRFAEYLNISREEAMRYVEQEVMDDEEVQVAPA